MKEFEIAFPASEYSGMDNTPVLPSREKLIDMASKKLGVSSANIRDVKILKKSLDARSRQILFKYRIEASLTSDPIEEQATLEDYKDVHNAKPVIIVGAGPAGLFAALRLLQRGFKPIILERGKNVKERTADIKKLREKLILDENSNYCFGEGGAGTFSDGKLYTRSTKRGNVYDILSQLISFGAKDDILIDAHPHIGSDILPKIMIKIRQCIEEHGGEYHFNTQVVDFVREQKGWKALCGNGNSFEAENVILATGNSANDIYELFSRKGWTIEAKGFAMGVRVEHPQMMINQIQYHRKYQPYLPAAAYNMVQNIEDRGVFTFCMCPGGILVPSSTHNGQLVMNGMSNSARDSKWANAGMVVSVQPEDINGYIIEGEKLSSEDPLSLLKFQKAAEQKAFDVTKSFIAPAQRMTDFVQGRVSNNLPTSSYEPGLVSTDLNNVLPSFISQKLKQALPLLNKKMKGYYSSNASLIAIESRTSSPVRIVRNRETYQHITQSGIYPTGEGAGYAGGIISSAIDGVNVANAIK